jgi:hypothetical protein
VEVVGGRNLTGECRVARSSRLLKLLDGTQRDFHRRFKDVALA